MKFGRNGYKTARSLVVSALLLMALAAALQGLPRRDAAEAAEPMVCGGSGVQILGFSEALNKTSFGGFPVTELSAITYEPTRGVFYTVADRAGTVAAHIFTISMPVFGDSIGTPVVVDVNRLAGPTGMPFTGLDFDGEGMTLRSNNEVFISSEGGSQAGEQPEIERFSVYGGRLGGLSVPAAFQIGTNNTSLEGISVSPSGRSLFVSSEVPLVADGRTADLRSRLRILRYEDRGQGFVPAQQYFYLTEPGRDATELSVSEILALSDTDLLVLEKGFVATEGNTVRLFKASLRQARDVSGLPALSSGGAQPLQKTLLVDLASCPDRGATVPPGAVQPNALFDNFEGMTLGPELPGNRRALVLVSDDNTATNQTTRIVVLAVDKAMLAGSGTGE